MNWFAKKVFDKGGGKRLKNQGKSTYYLYKALNRVKILIQNFIKKFENLNQKLTFAASDKIGEVGLRATQFIRKWLSFFQKLRLHSVSRGSILIEFAVCMPVLIILLFYINDLVRLKRLHSQTEFVAQQMANILQNISQKREGADRKITNPDIRYAASLAYLSMFPGTSRFTQSVDKVHKSDFGYNGLGYIFCVKGNPDSTASVLWTRRFHFADRAENPSAVAIDQGRLERSNVKRLTNASPSEIYPTLKINPDEIKIIIECGVHYSRSQAYYFTDGRATSDVSPAEAFGLRLFNLSPDSTRAGSNDSIFFLSAVIFTPKPGLFDATPPKEQN